MRQALGKVAILSRETFALDSAKPVSDQIGAIKHRLVAFIGQHRLETASRFLAVPSPSVMWRRIVLPAVARENLSDALRYEAEKYLPIPLEELYWDYQLIEDNRSTAELSLLLAVIKRSDLAPFAELAEQLPGGLSGAEPAASAIANVFHRHADALPGGSCALLVLAADQMHLIHMQDGTLQGGRTYPRPSDEAATIAGLRKGLEALRLVGGEATETDLLPVMVCADDAEEALVTRFPEALPQFAWHRMDWRENALPEPDMLPAYGLALKGLQKPLVAINLLPLRLRKRPSRLGQYLMVALVVLTMISGLTWGGSALLQKRFHHARLDREINRLADEVADIDRLQAGTQVLRTKLEFLQEQKGGPYNVLDILKTLTEIIPDSAWVREISIEPDGIRLDGYADAAAELIPLIDASPLFTDVSFLSAITKGRDGKEKFRIGFKSTASRP